MKITTLSYFMVIMGVLFMGFYTILGSFTTEDAYDVQVDTTYGANYSELVDYDSIVDTKNDITKIKTDSQSQFFTGIWDGIKRGISLIFKGFEVSFNTIGMMEGHLNIPNGVINFILTIIAIGFIGAIFTIILKVKS